MFILSLYVLNLKDSLKITFIDSDETQEFILDCILFHKEKTGTQLLPILGQVLKLKPVNIFYINLLLTFFEEEFVNGLSN